jgi:hypothetical protein
MAVLKRPGGNAIIAILAVLCLTFAGASAFALVQWHNSAVMRKETQAQLEQAQKELDTLKSSNQLIARAKQWSGQDPAYDNNTKVGNPCGAVPLFNMVEPTPVKAGNFNGTLEMRQSAPGTCLNYYWPRIVPAPGSTAPYRLEFWAERKGIDRELRFLYAQNSNNPASSGWTAGEYLEPGSRFNVKVISEGSEAWLLPEAKVVA